MAQNDHHRRPPPPLLVLFKNALEVRRVDSEAHPSRPLWESLDERDVVESVIGISHHHGHSEHRREVHLMVADDGQQPDVHCFSAHHAIFDRRLLRRDGHSSEAHALATRELDAKRHLCLFARKIESRGAPLAGPEHIAE